MLTALVAVERGEPIVVAAGMSKWLLSCGFVKAGIVAAPPVITPRGRLWLASFEEDMAMVAAEPTAADLASRRA